VDLESGGLTVRRKIIMTRVDLESGGPRYLYRHVNSRLKLFMTSCMRLMMEVFAAALA